MQSLLGAARSARTRCYSSSNVPDLSSVRVSLGFGGSGNGSSCSLLHVFASSLHSMVSMPSSLNCKVGEEVRHCASSPLTRFSQRTMSTVAENASDPALPIAPRIKFKRLDKTARNIMQILDREAVSEVKSQREVPDIKPGYIIQMKVESPENKRRITTIKGIVIARRNAGLNTTFRLRRLVAGVGVESLFPLYSPNIKEVKVLDKKKVRRAKLYYLREKMNPLKK